MDQSSNYFEFVTKLCGYACENEIDDSFAFLCTIHAIEIPDLSYFEKLRLKYPDSILAKPIFLRYQHYFQEIHDWDLYLQATEYAIAQQPHDWILLILERFKFEFFHSRSSMSAEQEDAFNKIGMLIQKNETMSVFTPILHQTKANLYYAEGSLDAAVSELMKSVDLYQCQNDVIHAMHIMRFIVLAIRNFDIKESIKWWKQAFNLCQKLGFVDGDITTWTIRGTICSTRGDFNGAEESYVKAIELTHKTHPRYPLRALPTNLMFAYNEMRRYRDALEWAEDDNAPFVASEPMTVLGITLLNKARAQIAMGWLQEAENNISVGHKNILRIGREKNLADYYLVSGLLEKAKGRYFDAEESFRKGYEAANSSNQQNRINSCCLRLAELQVQTVDSETEDILHRKDNDWVSFIEMRARNRGYPGILGQALILKAMYLNKLSRFGEAKKALEEAIPIANRPGSRYLHFFLKDVMNLLKHTE
ncbi:MAG: hypothetical protein JW779_15825 [Candidatus Thorarchaeota archaeon]|nr:hypothetical protein [Candidatus Thorarchaeota archaeon]